MTGLIGKKIGMSSYFDEDGKNIPCTVIEAQDNVVTQVRTMEVDNYEAVQLGYGEKKEKNTPKPMLVHFKNANTTPKHKLIEFRDFEGDVKVGDKVTIDLFEEGDIVHVVGTSKGKGFQGVVKRHGFKGVNDATHGQHNRARSAGSIGASSYPSRVFKGMRMSGHMGSERNTVKNLEVLKIIAEKNLMLVKGAIPGHKGAYIIVSKA